MSPPVSFEVSMKTSILGPPSVLYSSMGWSLAHSLTILKEILFGATDMNNI